MRLHFITKSKRLIVKSHEPLEFDSLNKGPMDKCEEERRRKVTSLSF